MKLEAGDLVLVPFPFTDLTAVKTRPALILSEGRYNAASRDVVVCAVTSNLANAAHSVLLDAGDMASGKMLAPSRAKADKVATLQQAIIRRKLGTLKPSARDAVLKEFFALFPDYP